MRKYPTEKMLRNMREFAEITREAVEATKHLKGMKRNVAIRTYIRARRKGLSKEEAKELVG